MSNILRCYLGNKLYYQVMLLQIHSLLLWLGESDLSSDCEDVTTFTGETQLPVLSFVAISLQRPYVCECMHVYDEGLMCSPK